MAEFASKGVAGVGLGTGIAGLALGVLNSSNNGNGLLGGLLGGGNQNVVSALQAENSQLKAENYSDKNAKEVYMQSLTAISLALRRASNSGVSVVLKDLRTVINVGLLSLSNRLSK